MSKIISIDAFRKGEALLVASQAAAHDVIAEVKVWVYLKLPNGNVSDLLWTAKRVALSKKPKKVFLHFAPDGVTKMDIVEMLESMVVRDPLPERYAKLEEVSYIEYKKHLGLK